VHFSNTHNSYSKKTASPLAGGGGGGLARGCHLLNFELGNSFALLMQEIYFRSLSISLFSLSLCVYIHIEVAVFIDVLLGIKRKVNFLFVNSIH
jgi:hypothetical protein